MKKLILAVLVMLCMAPVALASRDATLQGYTMHALQAGDMICRPDGKGGAYCYDLPPGTLVAIPVRPDSSGTE